MILNNVKDLPPRPTHKKGSACVLGKLWDKHRNVPFLPDSAFAKYRYKPSAKERAAERRAAKARSERARYVPRQGRACQTPAERKERQKAAKARYENSEKGIQTKRRYYAAKNGERAAKARERYHNDHEYRESKKKVTLARYHERRKARETGS